MAMVSSAHSPCCSASPGERSRQRPRKQLREQRHDGRPPGRSVRWCGLDRTRWVLLRSRLGSHDKGRGGSPQSISAMQPSCDPVFAERPVVWITCPRRQATWTGTQRWPHRCRTLTPSSSAPASPACTSSTACASWASACACSRPAPASAAPGTGTAIPAPASIPKATPTSISFSPGAAGGMELVGALRRPARDPALSQPRRRQVRPAPRHPVPQPRHRRPLAGRRPHLGRDAGGRQQPPRPLPDHRHRPALGADHAAHRGRRQLQGPVLPHRALAARAGQLRGQARRRHRHRRHRRADHRGSRQDRRPPHRVPAHAQLVQAAAQRPHRRRDPDQDQGQLSRDVQALPGDLRLLHPHRRPARHLRGDAARSARRSSRSSTRRPALPCGRAISATC